MEAQFVEKHVNMHRRQSKWKVSGSVTALISRLQTKDTKTTVTMRCLKTRSRQRAVQMRRETVQRKQQIIQKQVKIPQTQRKERCQDCAAQRPHDGAHEENSERTVRREHLMRRSQMQGSTRRADQSINVCVEKCPLAMRHMAIAAGAAAEEQKRSCRALLDELRRVAT